MRGVRALPDGLSDESLDVASLIAAFEAELKRKQNELAHFSRVAMMAELASVMAHELDQPLTAVITNAEAIRYMLQSEQPDLAEADAALRDVIEAAMRVSEICRRERKLLRKSEVTIEPADVNEMIREIELFMRAEVRHVSATLTLDLADALPAVMVDRVQVQQVILNLARNALQAMMSQTPAARTLAIRTSASGEEVIVEVNDAGPAIDDEQMVRMFEPFFTTKPTGLGMGLSISRTIVESYDGRIWPTRNPGAGLTMHVAFACMKDGDNASQ